MAPLVVKVDPNLNVILTACLTVYVGCYRSVKPTPPSVSMVAFKLILPLSCLFINDFISKLAFNVMSIIQETMSNKHAMRFPFVGSAMLLSLFLLFKFLSKDLVNAVLTCYFFVLGIIALSYVISVSVCYYCFTFIQLVHLMSYSFLSLSHLFFLPSLSGQQYCLP